MGRDAANQDDAVRRIYSAAAGRTPWQSALDELALSAGARSVQLLGLDRKAGGILFSHAGSGTAPQAHLDYLRAWHQADPGLPALVSARASEWLHCHERFGEARIESDPFWQQYLIPAGGRFRSGTKLVEDEHLVVLFGVHHGNAPLEPRAFDLLERFRGHLAEAMSIYRHLRAVRLEQMAAAQLLHGIAYPVVLVDSMRGILFRNRAAEEALRAGDYVTDRGGMLGCAHPSDDAELTIAVQAIDLLRDASPAAMPGRRFLRMRRAGGGSVVGVYVSALIPRPVTDAFGQPPAALLVFHDTGRHERLDPFVVAEMYGLTPAEARVAVRLARGQDVSAISRETGRSVETVRTHVKSILLKTGLERQSELVRALASLQPLQGPAT